jgi:sugar (pentulose or hexulose) kinase
MVVPASDTAAALSARRCWRASASGVYKSSFAEAAAEKIVKIRRTQEPNRDLRRVYDAYYQIYRRLYPDTKDLMRAIGAAEVMGGQHS